ncbi:DUF2165 family protein [Psychromonas sp. KJ10-2]|uniref:DUF2165 family protein n=1 Tax=Psychromonas sp. KJ10-2 TaxID=3391822 RepID=UPI0039B6D9D7
MLKTLTQDKAQFNQAKKLANIGLFVGIILWFTGFMTIGSESFLITYLQWARGSISIYCYFVSDIRAY